MTLVTNETIDESIQAVIQSKIDLNDGLIERNEGEKSMMKSLLNNLKN